MLYTISRIRCRAPARIEDTISDTSIFYLINYITCKFLIIIPACKYITCSNRSFQYDCLTFNVIRTNISIDTIIQVLVCNLVFLRNPHRIQCYCAAVHIRKILDILRIGITHFAILCEAPSAKHIIVTHECIGR